MQKIIEIKNLIKDFGHDASAVHVIRGINLDIFPGEFAIIFGPSGSGKSTLLNIINCLETPTAGDVIIDNMPISSLNEEQRSVFHQQKIGMVFQAYNLISSLSVIENITLPLTFSKIDESERIERAKSLLADFGLSEIASRYPSEISGGQAQRVGIMRALINKPPIIIADEPTGNLDSIASKNVMDLFANLNEKFHNTMVVVTHDQSLFTYADRVIHILDGKIVKETVRHKTGKNAEKRQKYEAGRLDALAKDTLDKRIVFILSVILSEQQLSSLDENELIKIIKHTRGLLNKEITIHEYYELLDKPTHKGGVGLYEPTARHITESIENIIKLTK